MSPLARLHPTTEGRRGSRIDLEEGALSGYPRTRSVRAFTSVKEPGRQPYDSEPSRRH